MTNLNFVEQRQMLVVAGHLEHDPVLQVQHHPLLLPVVADELVQGVRHRHPPDQAAVC